METLEELQKVLDDAPEGATHVDSDNAYIKWVKTEGLHFNYGNKWSDWEVMEIQDIEVMRSLADIQRIVDLMIWQEKANLNYQSMTEAYLND